MPWDHDRQNSSFAPLRGCAGGRALPACTSGLRTIGPVCRHGRLVVRVAAGSICRTVRASEFACRASYAVGGGDTLQQQLRCAGDSYRFEVTSSVASRAGSLSGNWSEMTRNVSGQISGRVAAGRIHARVDAGVFTADLTVNTNGAQQSVSIVPQGTDIKIVAVTMRKS